MSEITTLDRINEILSSIQHLDEDISKFDLNEVKPLAMEITSLAVLIQLNNIMETVTNFLKYYPPQIGEEDKPEVISLHKIVVIDDILRTRLFRIRKELENKE